MLKPDGGRVELGARTSRTAPRDIIAGKGIRRTFQAGKLVPGLTVRENVMAA